eukprot:1183413-Pleurochrysis_carterae.AAC.1
MKLGVEAKVHAFLGVQTSVCAVFAGAQALRARCVHAHSCALRARTLMCVRTPKSERAVDRAERSKQ